MHKIVRFLANQRLDLPDLRDTSVYNEYEWSTFGVNVLAGGSPYVIKGFVVTVVAGLDIAVTVDDLVMITPDGKYNRWLSTEPQLTISVTNNSTNYVEAQIYTETSKSETRVLWDASAGGGAGEEYTQTMDTADCQKTRLVVNTTGFSGDSDKVPVCTVLAAAGAITKLQDNYSFVVVGDGVEFFPENKFFKLNDADMDGIQDRFAFGAPRTDTTINTLKDFVDAVLTEIAEIKGDGATTAAGAENDWFIERPADLFSANQDRNARLTEGGAIGWAIVANQLSFSSDLIIRIPAIAGTNTIQVGQSPITIDAAGKCAYVTLDRDTAGAANLVPTVAAYGSVPADKDTFIIAIRGSDGRIYLADGTGISASDTVFLGGAASPADSAIISVVDNVTYTSGDYNVGDYADASTCIQAAIDAVKTDGAVLYIRAGTYNIDAALSFAGATKNVRVTGDGVDTILTQDGAVNVFTIPQDIDDIQIEKLKIIGDETAATNIIDGVDNENIVLSELVIDDGAAHVLNKCFIYFTGNASGDVKRITINDCLMLLESPSSSAIKFYGYAEDINIRNNKIYGNAVIGGSNGNVAIRLDDNTTDASMGRHINISGNMIYLDGDDQIPWGVHVQGDYQRVVVSDNNIVLGNDNSVACYGIFFKTGTRTSDVYSYSTITGNTVKCDAGTDSATRALYIDGDPGQEMRGFAISGNNFIVASGGATDYSVRFNDALFISMEGNMLLGGDTRSLYMSNVTNSHIGVNYESAGNGLSLSLENNSFNINQQIIKGWVNMAINASVNQSYNVSGTNDDGVGMTTIEWDRNFANIYYVITAELILNGIGRTINISTPLAVGSCAVWVYSTLGAGYEDLPFCAHASGLSAD